MSENFFIPENACNCDGPGDCIEVQLQRKDFLPIWCKQGINNDERIRCGYPLCKYFSYKAESMCCPMPIGGTPCQGMGNPYEHYYGINKPID